MAFSNWLCTNNMKRMFVKIVHPGGHVELHDRPVLAAEIMHRNPRCCVAHPNVFQKPWAIVAPETTLTPGHKFYVVPINTVRKLQRHSSKYSPSLVREIQSSQSGKDKGEEDDSASTCWLITNKNTPKFSFACLRQPNSERDNPNHPTEKNGHCLDDNCFTCLFSGINIKASSGEEDTSSKETGSSCSFGSSETKVLTHKRTKKITKKIGSPKRFSSFDYWHPNLESITEE